MADRDALAAEIDAMLADEDAQLATQYPGDRGIRQPVHTVYIPAHRFDAHTLDQWGAQAREAFAEHCPDPDAMTSIFGVEPALGADIWQRVQDKLASEPIEDLRVDFEDGYGARGDDEEDAAVVQAACDLFGSKATPFRGIRFKSFEAPTRHRGLRTLTQFVEQAVALGGVDQRLLLTLPKVTGLGQVAAMALVCDRLEKELGLAAGQLGFEIQVETPQSILGANGTVLVAQMIQAAGGRCTGLHYGTYDYSASCGIAAAYQSMEHPAADHAKAIMQVAAAGTGVFLSDGSTNVMPTGSADVVRSAWGLHSRLTRRSLERGFYQGWDLHPAQLPSRFVATYAFYREGLPSAARRLRAYVHGGDSGFMDEPATATALAGFVARGVDCGAIGETEVKTLIDIDEAQLAVLARRAKAAS